MCEVESARDDVSVCDVGEVSAVERRADEDEASTSVREERIEGGEEGVGEDEVRQDNLCFVTVIVGLL